MNSANLPIAPLSGRAYTPSPTAKSIREPSIDDYAERTVETVAAWNAMNGQQTGDPGRLAAALVMLAGRENPPRRWVAGADAVATVEQKAKDLLAQVDTYRELSSNLAHDDVTRSIPAVPCNRSGPSGSASSSGKQRSLSDWRPPVRAN